ncbi:MAG: hypothetical protein KGZ73_05160 [Rhizobiales bacterium]|nr:hypothetical protein [Hyphomicrobiales bacterium]
MAGKNGGARPGAGRPKGSFNKPQLREFFTEDEVKALAEQLKERAKTDSTILKFLGEQIFGKPTQPISGPDGGPIEIKGVTIAVRRK